MSAPVVKDARKTTVTLNDFLDVNISVNCDYDCETCPAYEPCSEFLGADPLFF